MSRHPYLLRALSAAPLAALGLALALAAPAAADDRNLLRTSGGDPYVFLLLDTSGSMNWASQCTIDDYNTFIDHDGDPSTPDVRKCNFICADGDCPTPRNADDPASKMRQAKEALYQVLQEVDNVNFGFATYNQDNLRVDQKHWLYTVDAVQADGFHSLDGGFQFPAAGAQEVFGPSIGCDRNSCPTINEPTGANVRDCNNNRGNWTPYEQACYPSDAALVSDAWQIEKARRLPKLGGPANWNTTITEYVKTNTTTYRVRYIPVGGGAVPPADSIAVDIEVRTCSGFNDTDLTCRVTGAATTKRITYSKVGDFVFWDIGVNPNSQQGGWFGSTWSNAGETCRGWDPSARLADNRYIGSDGTMSQTDSDPYSGYSLKRQTTATGYYDPPGTAFDWLFWEGDVVPLNWNTNNKDTILRRLAPALAGGDPASNPEAFAQANYLQDSRAGADTFLRLKPAFDGAGLLKNPPLIANGSTPLAGSLAFFRYWYSGCGGPGNCDATGWSDIAAVQDPNWECRKKYMIILTDGEETCDNSPNGSNYYGTNGTKFPPGFQSNADSCRYVASMQSQEDIQSFVIAFGVRQSPKINCLSSKSQPFYVDTKQELVDVLRSIFGEIQEQAAAFASAAVPSVQANVADKIYLSSFIPLNQEAVWPGRIDAFLKPLPLDTNNLPDRTRLCGPTGASECFLWDAADGQPAWDGEAGYVPKGLLLQAPTEDEIDYDQVSTLQIGPGDTERRVYFGLPNASTADGKRQEFTFPDTAAKQNEFEWVWNLSAAPADDAANLDLIKRIVATTLMEKQGEITDPVTDITTHVQYVMGDIFHSNPIVLNQPADFDLYTKNLYAGQTLCTGETAAQATLRSSYAYWADRHACRRKILFVGSNDGQVHAFDTGIYEGNDCKFPTQADRNGDGQPDGDGTPIDGKFDNGTGKELFSFIPAQMMPVIKQLTEIDDLAGSGLYAVDGNMRTADIFIDPVHNGTPTCTDREWRTILLGTYREGGPGFFVLDVTQPDEIDDSNNVPSAGAGDWVPSCTAGGGECGPLPFPAKLFEFEDVVTVAGVTTPADEDLNFQADLGESWGLPVVSRLRICRSGCDGATPQLEDRWVAIFGGGLSESPTNTSADGTGNWLYIADLETGRILYKRGGAPRAGRTDSIIGSVPADITTVDFNNNGYVDTLYFGTTAGYVYKVALGDGPFELDVATGQILDPLKEGGSRDAGALNPFQVFFTGDNTAPGGRPIYYEIAAVYVPKLRAVALAFGTGNRWNLWEFNGQPGRFYAITDLGWQDADRNGVIDSECGGCPAPLDYSVYQAVDPDSPFDPASPPPDYLTDVTDPTPGWYLTLDANERLITEAFSLSGITVFTAYSPNQTETDGRCAVGGESKIFIVGTLNAIGYARAVGSTERTRFFTAPTFTTQPFVEQSATKNPDSGGTGGNADQLTEELKQVKKELERLFPTGCRFANYTLNIKTVRSDTGLVFIAPVPVCIEPTNWKEF
jgi:Tfp pilus tip-associated adhesin PilY1